MKKIIPTLLLFFLLTISTCYAASHNWVWIDSNNKFGYFLDTSTIMTQKNNLGKIISADIWMKVKYSYEGAKQDIDDYDLNCTPEELQNGYSLYKLKLDFFNDEITRENVIVYDGNSERIYLDTDISKFPVAQWSFYWNIYTYTMSYLTGNDAFKIKKSYSTKITDEWKFPIWLIRKEGNLIKLTLIHKDSVFWVYFNDKRMSKTQKIWMNDYHKYVFCEDENFTPIIPNSTYEGIYELCNTAIQKYPSFMNRYQGGGLTPK